MIPLTWHQIRVEEKTVIKGMLSNSYFSLIYCLFYELLQGREGGLSLFSYKLVKALCKLLSKLSLL